MLAQDTDDLEKAVAQASHSLMAAERQLWAIVWAVHNLRYIYTRIYMGCVYIRVYIPIPYIYHKELGV